MKNSRKVNNEVELYNPGDCVLGIDPGVNGGISVWRVKPDSDTLTMAFNYKLYDLRSNLIDIIELNKLYDNKLHVFIERIWGNPNNSAVANGKKMETLGEIRGLLCGMDINNIEYMNPATWKKYAYSGLRRKNAHTKRLASDALVGLMGEFYAKTVAPGLVDCILIGWYGVNACKNYHRDESVA